MEKTTNATITITDVDWSDIGSWQGVWECLKKINKIITQTIRI